MVIVLKMQGKGSDSCADKVSVHLFDTQFESQDFIEKNTDNSKYWSYCEVIKEGEVWDVYPDFN